MKKAWNEIDKKVYLTTYFLILVILGILALCPAQFQQVIDVCYNFVVSQVGWMYVLVSAWCFAVFFYLYFGKYGSIKLGEPDEKPRFSTFSWASMIFTSGAGSSIIILGFAEPVYYLTNTPFHAEPLSVEAFEYAHMYGQFHWGMSAWAFYIPAITAISYMLYKRKSRDVKLSATMVPLFGTKFPQSFLGRTIDIIIAFGTVFSITTSLGLAVPVMSRLISYVLGIEDTLIVRICVFVIWFLIFGGSVFRGLDRGILKLTNINMVLIFGFLALFALVVPISRILSMELNSVGLYFSELPRMVFYTDPFGDQKFITDWTLFYWAWWLTFIPIMGIFVTKVSRGRTLRQVLLGQIVWGTLGCCVFLGILGGYSLHLQKTGTLDLVSILAESGNAGVVLAIMNTLPMSNFFIVFLIVLCFVFLATTIDSTALVLGNATSHKLDPDQDPHLFNRFSWAIAIFALSIGLSFTGGLELIQKFAIILGFPIVFIVITMTVSIFKAMKEDNAGEEK